MWHKKREPFATLGWQQFKWIGQIDSKRMPKNKNDYSIRDERP